MEALLPILVAFVMPITIVGMVLRYLEKRRKDAAAGADTAGNSLTTSELQEMIEESVERALLPVAEKVHTIDRDLQHLKRQLPEAETAGIRRISSSTGEEQSDTDEEQAKSLGRQRLH